MTQITHKVTLSSSRHYGKRLPPHEAGLFIAEVPESIRYATSMAMRSRSTQKGKRPAWLERATDIRFVGLEGDGESSTLYFEAPPLGEAAAEFYSQKDLFWSPPSAEYTAFDLLGAALGDVESNDADSDRIDRPLLRRLLRFRHVFGGTFSSARFETPGRESDRKAHLDLLILRTAECLLDETPAPRQVRIVGKLDMVRASNQTFGLTLEGGQEVRGVLVDGSIEEMAPHLRKELLVFGRAVFRPSGRLLRVDADEFRPAQDSDRFFAKIPKPMSRARQKSKPRERERAAEWLRSAMGKWPGDETDEQISQALGELR
jgi:hypothetical protein